MSRNYQTLEYLRYLLEKEPELAFHEDMSPEEFPAWQQRVKDKVRELMRLDDVYETPEVNLLTVKQRDGYRIEKYEVSSEPGLWNTMLVLIPDGADEENPAPAVLCMPGSCALKEQLAGEDSYDLDDMSPVYADYPTRHPFANAMAMHCVRQGYVAVAVDDFFVGETAHSEGVFDVWTQASQILQAMGKSMLGITCGMRLAQLKWLKARPWVDRNRLGMIGFSLGTEPAMLLGLLDEDLKAFVFNDFLSDTKERTLAVYPTEKYYCYITPYKDYFECYKYFTYPDLLAAYAPRALLIPEGGVTKLLKKVKAAYALSGQPDAFRYEYYEDFADPAARLYDDEPMPSGITQQEYFLRSNVVPAKHGFKRAIALPWLEAVLKDRQG